MPWPQATSRTMCTMSLPSYCEFIPPAPKTWLLLVCYLTADNVARGEPLPTFTVRCVSVTKRMDMGLPSRMDTFLRGTAPRRRVTRSPELGPPLVKAKASGPLSWVTLLGFFLAVILFASSIIFGDGFSLLTTILLSLLSTLVGISNKWNLKLPRRPRTDAPPGDVVIRYPNGSWLIVRCDEDVARELYFAPEEIEYTIKSPTVYRLLSLVGTLMLMLGVITLANAKLQLQFAWAGAYIIINIAHWVVAALPQKMHWDLSCYEVREQGVEGGPSNPNFTEALWKAILLTKDINWVENGEAAPKTPVWKDWLQEAKTQARFYKSHTGPLMNPLWKGGDVNNAVIWESPKPEIWDAKRAWDRLNKEFLAKEKGESGELTAPPPPPLSTAKPPVDTSVVTLRSSSSSGSSGQDEKLAKPSPAVLRK